MTTFTALGDSITLGIGDPVPGVRPGCRRWRGWAELLASCLPEPDLRMLAVSGARVADVRYRQLPLALAASPRLASVIVGINDMLRPDFDPGQFADAIEEILVSLRGQGADVLTIRLPAAGRMLGLPGVLARPLARRTEQVNAVLDDAARRHRTMHFDAASDPASYQRRMWAADRLHPNERGHRHIARRFHDLLAEAGYPLLGPPEAEPVSPTPSRLAEAGWLATKGTGWVLSRSTDLVPHLLGLAARELIDRGRGDETGLIGVSWSRHRAPAK